MSTTSSPQVVMTHGCAFFGDVHLGMRFLAPESVLGMDFIWDWRAGWPLRAVCVGCVQTGGMGLRDMEFDELY